MESDDEVQDTNEEFEWDYDSQDETDEGVELDLGGDHAYSDSVIKSYFNFPNS